MRTMTSLEAVYDDSCPKAAYDETQSGGSI